MLRFSGLVMTIALLVYIVFFLLRWLKRREKLEMIIFKTCLYVYVCGVIKFTIFPLMLDAALIEDTKIYVTGSYMNLIPFNKRNVHAWGRLRYVPNSSQFYPICSAWNAFTIMLPKNNVEKCFRYKYIRNCGNRKRTINTRSHLPITI